MFDFTKKLFGEIVPQTTRDIYQTAAPKLKQFSKDLLSVFGGATRFVKPGLALPTRASKDSKRRVTEAVAGIGTKVLPTLAKETVAGLETFGKTTLEGVYGRDFVSKHYDTSNEKFYGRKVSSLQEIYDRSKTFVGDTGGSPLEQVIYPVLGTVGYAAIESPLGLPAKEVKLSKGLVDSLIKTTDKKAATTLIKNNLSGISDRSAARIADNIVAAKTENEVLKSFGGTRARILGEVDETADLGASPATVAELDTVQKQVSSQKYKVTPDVTDNPTKISSVSDENTFGYNFSKEADKVNLGEAISPLVKDEKSLKKFPEWKQKFEDSYVNTREWLQDDWFRMKKMLQDENVDILGVDNPYLRETLLHGRIGSRLDAVKDFQDGFAKKLTKQAKDFSKTTGKKVENTQVSKEIHDYLLARHAPERNAVHGDGAAGITTAVAKKNLKEINSRPYAKELKDSAEELQDIHNEVIDILYQGEVISKETRDVLTKTYKHHVPLNRVMEGDDWGAALGRSFEVKGTGIRAAKGSDKEVTDIASNILANYEQAVARAEKNRLNLSVLNFFRDNKKFFGDDVTIRKPKQIGKDFRGNPIMETIDDPKTLVLREGGKPVVLEFADESLATMFRGANREQLNLLMRMSGAMTRMFSGLATRFNPNFWLSNKVRDLQEVLVYVDAETKGKIRARDVLKYEGRAEKAVRDAITGKKPDSKMVKLYQQMLKDGGTTGGMALSTIAEQKVNWSKALKTNRSNPRKALKFLTDGIDNTNKVFEDSSRLAVYGAALDRGFTREQAAFLAKNASVNFNKMGKAGPVLNSMYMFANASLQGSAKMLRAMKNPKTAAKVTTAVAGAVILVNQHNSRVDPDWKDKVTTWDRLNGLNIMLPTDEGVKYITLPVSWGIKPIKAMVDSSYDLMEGDTTLSQASQNVAAATVEAYNPIGGTDLFSAVTPSFLGPVPTDLLADLARNRTWYGGKLKPDWDPYAPESTRYFSDIEDTIVGRNSLAVSNGLSGIGIEVSPEDMVYTFDNLVGGAGRFVSQTADTIRAIGEPELKLEKSPFINRFFRSKPGDRVDAAGKNFEEIKGALTEQSRERSTLKYQAEKTAQQLLNMPRTEASRRFGELATTDPDLAEKINDVIQKKALGLTTTDRMLLDLNVRNGKRAEHIAKQFNQMKTREQKAELWNSLVAKKIITPEVSKQLVDLLDK